MRHAEYSNKTDDETRSSLLHNTIIPFAKLILAIRKELGHKNKKLDEIDVSRLYINDVDNVLLKLFASQTIH